MDKAILYAGGAAAVYFFFLKPGAASPLTATTAATTTTAAGGGQPYGVNNGLGGVSNYAQLVQINPNLGNPNYHMTLPEAQTYLANYLDLQQGLPGWVNHKVNGITARSLPEAAQAHWTIYGCAEKRIFLPLVPPSTKPYQPPVSNAKSSGGSSSWVSTALQVAGSVAIALIGTEPTDPQLNNAEVQQLITGGAILSDILPFYVSAGDNLAPRIQSRLTELLTQYT